jgi:N-methylhydantoinase A
MDWEQVNQVYREMEAQGREILLRSGVPERDMIFQRLADLRYAGQGHEVRVEMPTGRLDSSHLPEIVARFELVYRALFGRAGPRVGLEVMSWRLIASGPRPELKLRTLRESRPAEAALKGHRLVYFPDWGERRPTPVYDRYALAPNTRFDGPAIVEERESTVVVGPRATVTVDEFRNVRVDVFS